MFKTSKILGVLGMALFLSACGNASLEQLRSTAPKGTPFQSQLAARYLQYSEQISKDGDSDRATYFADKGLQAAYGNDVSPEDPINSKAASDDLLALDDASEKLLSLLDSHSGENRPREFADLQFYYDCWVDQSAINGSDVDFCRDKFIETHESFKKVAETETEQTEDKETKDAAVTQGEVQPARISYLVYFALNRAELNDAAKRIVDEILKDLADKGEVEIAVSGHTDTSGTNKHNMKLSELRAASVKKALVALGIAEARIKTFGFGETDPVVATGDGVVEEKNRRVEIVVN